MEYVEVLAGFALLLFGGNFLVKGSVNIARKFKVSSLIIGMTVVALGTSAPEFIVSLTSAIKGQPEICLGNVIGSNIANIGLILGITAIILPLTVTRTSVKIDTPFMIICSIALLLIMEDNSISRIDGAILTASFIGFLIFSIKRSLGRQKVTNTEVEIKEPNYSITMSLGLIVVSCIALGFGSNLLVDGVSAIASNIGISERVISLTVVAVGTSLPELVTSIIAVSKKQSDIAIGNVIGSNIFNILFVIGTSALIYPINNFNFTDFKVDLIWMIAIAVLLSICIFPIRRIFKKNPKGENRYSKLGIISGSVLLLSYIAYIVLMLQA